MEGAEDEKVKAILKEAERDQKHYAAFGRFIAAYALAEAMLHTAARYFSGIEDAAPRIIFSGMRLGDLAERVRGLTRSKGEIHSEIDACLIHLEKIAKVRHKLVHRTVTLLSAGGMMVSNNLIAKSLLDAEEDTFDLETLENMGRDCIVIAVRLIFLTEPNLPNREAADLRSKHGAWRYKPPPPKSKGKSRRKARQ